MPAQWVVMCWDGSIPIGVVLHNTTQAHEESLECRLRAVFSYPLFSDVHVNSIEQRMDDVAPRC
jgi:hypothetical protein